MNVETTNFSPLIHRPTQEVAVELKVDQQNHPLPFEFRTTTRMSITVISWTGWGIPILALSQKPTRFLFHATARVCEEQRVY